MGGGIGIITSGEVSIVRSYDGVFVSLLHILSVPLSNTRSTSIGQHSTAELSQSLSLGKWRGVEISQIKRRVIAGHYKKNIFSTQFL